MIDEDWIRVGDLQVDPRLLEKTQTARCSIAECQAACCGHGVYVDLAEASRIVEEADLIKPHLPADRWDVSIWFDGNVRADSDFPTGFRVGTRTVADPAHPSGTRCIFLRPEDNFCGIQYASVAEGRHPWDLKPFYCKLYPLVVLADKLMIDGDNELFSFGGSCQRPAPVPLPLHVLFKDEMVLALGEKGYEEFRALARKAGAATG